MKTKITSVIGIAIFAVLLSVKSMGWGTDVIIHPAAPFAQHSIAAKQTGVLFAGVPVSLVTMEYSAIFYTSTDLGATWQLLPTPAPSALSPVLRSKMIVTSLDSVICVIFQGSTLYFVNVESGVVGQFTTTGVQEFDVAAGSGNFIYTYVQEPATNTIKRYGTGNGGITWTGNTATVTTQGSRPRITMSGTRLILNYYGPVLPDTVSSVIRAAIYNETAAGTLAASTFQDVAFDIGVKRKQFQSVVNNGIVWFLFTEGDTQQVLKCRLSLDNGVSYQLEFVVTGNAQVNAHWFGASPITYSGTFGLTLTWLADSIAPVGPFNQMQFAIATNSNPGIFTIPPPPLDTYNDTDATSSATNILPILVNFNDGLNVESGVAWLGETSSGPVLFYDRFMATTGLEQINDPNAMFSVYPSPANDFIYISNKNVNLPVTSIEIYNIQGSKILNVPVATTGNNPTQKVNISDLSAGNYFVKIQTTGGNAIRKILVVK